MKPILPALLVLCLAGIISGQSLDTVRLIQPFPDYSLTEDDTLKVDYRPYLELKLRQGAIRYDLRHGWPDQDPSFFLGLDTASKTLRLASQFPYWGEVRVRLFHVSSWENLDSTFIDEFIVRYDQVKDDPVYHIPLPANLTEDVPVILDLDNHFFDFDNLRPYRYSVVKTSPGLDAALQGKTLILTPKPDYHGPAEVTLAAANSLDSQWTGTLPFTIAPINDPPRLIAPLRDTAVPYFEGLYVNPLNHWRDMDDTLDDQQRHVYSLEMDPALLAGSNIPFPPWHAHTVGPLGTAWIKINAIDPVLGPFSTRAQVMVNGAWPVGKPMLLPPPPAPAWDGYPARAEYAWVDPMRGVLRVPTEIGNILLDPRRQLLTPPFNLKPGSCIVAEPSGWNEHGEPNPGRLWFIGQAVWAHGATGAADPSAAQNWSYRTVEAPAEVTDAKACAYDQPTPNSAFRVVRWNEHAAGAYSFEGGTAGKESRLETPDSVRILDVLPFGSRILVLSLVTRPASAEREVLRLDAYSASPIDQAFSSPPSSQSLSAYEPFEGRDSLVSRIFHGRLWASGHGLEVLWSKVDRVKADDIYSVPGGTRMLRSVLDSSLSVKASRIRLNHTSGSFAQLRIVNIDVIGPGDARLYWANNDGSCYDISLANTRIDPTDPSGIFPVVYEPLRDCGQASEQPFGIPHHFGGGRSSLTFGRNEAFKKYLRFDGAFPVSVRDAAPNARDKEKGPRRIGISRGTVLLGGKAHDLLGRRHPSSTLKYPGP